MHVLNVFRLVFAESILNVGNFYLFIYSEYILVYLPDVIYFRILLSFVHSDIFTEKICWKNVQIESPY